jgi:DNA mismatch endonuclease, patch repair protein
MSRIRGKDTQPELMVRRAFWAVGLRYRLHDKRLPGRPDMVLRRQRTAIFVHGCFWHWHDGCANFRIPKTRSEWWTRKLAQNKVRDVEVLAELDARGWRSIVIWECEATDERKLVAMATSLRTLGKRRSAKETPYRVQ